MADKLKPCPFCGKKPKLKNRFIQESQCLRRVFIFCSCGISLYGGLYATGKISMQSVVEDELIEIWNMRVGDKND